MRVNVKRIAMLSVMIALAMVMSYIESLIPVFIPVPGLKIGLANIVSLVCLSVFGLGAAFTVSILRICLSSLLFGNAVAFIYSLFGGLLSLAVMYGLKRLRLLSTVGVSVGGAVFHNIGQIIAACIVMGTGAVITYLPPLILGGVGAGIVIGICSALLTERVRKVAKL